VEGGGNSSALKSGTLQGGKAKEPLEGGSTTGEHESLSRGVKGQVPGKGIGGNVPHGSLKSLSQRALNVKIRGLFGGKRKKNWGEEGLGGGGRPQTNAPGAGRVGKHASL